MMEPFRRLESSALPIARANGRHRFESNAFGRHCLLEGIDELGYTLSQMERIVAFERRYSQRSG